MRTRASTPWMISITLISNTKRTPPWSRRATLLFPTSTLKPRCTPSSPYPPTTPNPSSSNWCLRETRFFSRCPTPDPIIWWNFLLLRESRGLRFTGFQKKTPRLIPPKKSPVTWIRAKNSCTWKVTLRNKRKGRTDPGVLTFAKFPSLLGPSKSSCSRTTEWWRSSPTKSFFKNRSSPSSGPWPKTLPQCSRKPYSISGAPAGI